jgi:hypothetical protein
MIAMSTAWLRGDAFRSLPIIPASAANACVNAARRPAADSSSAALYARSFSGVTAVTVSAPTQISIPALLLRFTLYSILFALRAKTSDHSSLHATP